MRAANQIPSALALEPLADNRGHIAGCRTQLRIQGSWVAVANRLDPLGDLARLLVAMGLGDCDLLMRKQEDGQFHPIGVASEIAKRRHIELEEVTRSWLGPEEYPKHGDAPKRKRPPRPRANQRDAA